jgi:hypothetical protein
MNIRARIRYNLPWISDAEMLRMLNKFDEEVTPGMACPYGHKYRTIGWDSKNGERLKCVRCDYETTKPMNGNGSNNGDKR